MSIGRRYVLGAVATALCVALSGAPVLAAPSTEEIRAKEAEAAEARAALEEMGADLEERIEQYDGLTEQLEKTRVEIERTEAELETATAERDAARRKLSGRATDIYKSGRIDVVSVLLGTTTLSDLLARLDLLARITSADARLVDEVEAAVSRVEAAEVTLQNREAEQVALRARSAAQRDEIQAGIERQEAYVTALDGEVKRLVAEEEERQRKLADERARKAAEAAAARAAEKRAAGGTEPATPVGDLPAGHPEVVDIALRYLGVPYVWGGSTPAGFDCSGLVQFCYAEIGIDLPRTSRSQYQAGTHIASDRLDLLVPGDLVFFGRDGDPSRVHHVGVYAGGGDFIHAPATGDVVKVSSLTERIAEKGDYVGASRF